MARDFDGSADLVGRNSVVSTATDNFTMACWVNQNTVVGTDSVYENGEGDGGGGTGYSLRVTTSGANHFARIDLSFVGSATGTTDLPAGEWHHICGIRRSGTTYIYTDGVQNGTTTTLTPNTPTNRYTIGSRNHVTSGASLFFLGRVAECAFWDSALTDSEIMSLAKGFSPAFISPGTLTSYIPLIGNNSPETDKMSSTTLTVTSAPPVYPHPRIIYPTSAQLRKYITAVVAPPTPSTGYPPTLLMMGAG